MKDKKLWKVMHLKISIILVINTFLLFILGVMMTTQERPFDLLNKSIGGRVMIRLKNGTEIRGVVSSFDVHMNLVMENAEELEEGNLKAKLGTILLRGGNILFVAPV
jgi:small nuclear ribonucleoprotein